jgi:hypothetical protein
MARKGILITDPSVAKMTQPQWMFEYMALSNKERSDREFSVKAIKSVLVATLGLNMLRPEDASGNPKRAEDMTAEDRESFMPLAAWIANEGILQRVKDQYDKLEIATSLPIVDDNYAAMVAAIDAAEGDIEPIIGIKDFVIPANPKKLHDEKMIGIMDKSDLDIAGKV